MCVAPFVNTLLPPGSLYLLVAVTCTGNVLGSIAGYFIDKKRREAMDKILHKRITIADFIAFDDNGDGQIEKSEFVLHKLQLMGLIEQADIDRAQKEFALMDEDGSGMISMEELHEFLKERDREKARRQAAQLHPHGKPKYNAGSDKIAPAS